MSLPSAISFLITQLNQELLETESEAIKGMSLSRQLMSSFPEKYHIAQVLFIFQQSPVLCGIF